MHAETLDKAIAEARRFIKAAEAARPAFKEREWGGGGTKESAAARRASMDLTRALADLRRPG